MKRQWDEDELAEQWTLAPDELALLANKAGPTRLGFAVFTFSSVVQTLHAAIKAL
jgi:hypothetical protein